MSAKINDGGPAFPCDSAKQFPTQEGMTLRDWFAGQADVTAYFPMESFCLNNNRQPTITELAEYIAKIRLIEADAMIAARDAKS
jgi:hypothetical protein